MMVVLSISLLVVPRTAQAEEPGPDTGLGCDSFGCACGYQCMSNECVIVAIPSTCATPDDCGPACLGLTCSPSGTCVTGARDAGPDATAATDVTAPPDVSSLVDTGSDLGVDAGAAVVDAFDVAQTDGSPVEGGSEGAFDVRGGCECAAAGTGRAEGSLGMALLACVLFAGAPRRRQRSA